MRARMSGRGSRLPLSLPLLVALATLIGWLVLVAPEAEAQVFKPRGKAAATGKASAASAAAARKAAAPAAPAATTAKKPARAAATTPRRAGNATPAKKGKSAGKARAEDEDDVKIEDDEDDVKITDD